MDDGITVTGLGEASAPADVVRINVGVQCDGSDVASALHDVGRRLAAVSAAARAQGIVDKDISTSSVSVYPRYGNDGMAILGYQASHQLEVTTHEIERVAELIAAFVGAAGNALTINSIVLSRKDLGPLAERARRQLSPRRRTRRSSMPGSRVAPWPMSCRWRSRQTRRRDGSPMRPGQRRG